MNDIYTILFFYNLVGITVLRIYVINANKFYIIVHMSFINGTS